ncbi:bifunctional (p)ppGpp synthetase/guanosine-3',5'-bis(diphosphate) 3'-pyrophosphohydrolase, partial [Candidatus Peregrinibacteria bacterium]|nr:bifunctional (p)ppGpp synthetase/guanosine-3',5'-bis(diphosphate) 3'-pyrophosphohydrolase [Candidatus Peregrinibacteria bacterium]
MESGQAAKLDLREDLPSVADIAATIDDGQGILEDGRFVREMSELLDLIDEERSNQGIEPYSYNQRVVLVHEAYRVALRYKDKRRKGRNRAGTAEERGDLVFYDHLVGATKILVSEIGLTGLSSVIAMLNHDTVEDFVDKGLAPRDKRPRERELYDSLVDVSFYKDKLIDFDEEEARRVFEDVKLVVEGVTKVRKATKEKELDATVAQLLNITRTSIRSVLIKLADRLHNLRTLDGHGDDAKGRAKQREIIDVTESVYLPLARIAGVQT